MTGLAEAAKLLLDPGKNRKIRLTDKEASILKYLFRAGDRAGRQGTGVGVFRAGLAMGGDGR